MVVRFKRWIAPLLLLICACSEDEPGAQTCPAGQRLVNGECVDRGRDIGGGEDAPEGDAGSDAGPDAPTETGEEPGDCRELATRCLDALTPQVCADGVWLDQEPCSQTTACENGRCVPRTACTPGQVAGCASDTAQRVCNDDGDLFETVACDPGPYCFQGTCGTQVCEPDDRRCGAGDFAIQRCAEDGESWVDDGACNPDDEQVCFEGECVSGCLASLKDPSYIGCEYWSVDLPQFQDPATPRDPREIPHSVVLANTGDRAADVTIETQSDVVVNPATVSIPVGGVTTVTFPRNDVEGTALTNRSFRITTTEPIIAYQFNPLNDENVFSNDASLLLPASAIGDDYYVLSWPGGVPIPGIGAQTGWFTVVATTEGVTNVTITFSADVVPGTSSPLQGITAGTTRTFPLTQWSVLNFECESTFSLPPRLNDLTGTHITSDNPIVVFAGHEEAVIGDDPEGEDSICCADHLEEQMIPVRSWGTHYLAVHTPPRGAEPDIWRVIASEPATGITTIPTVSGLDGVTLDAGEWVEVSTPLSFEIISTAPVAVGQYMVSQAAAGTEEYIGDPSLILTVPVDQFREEYALLAPDGYARDYVTVIRPAGAAITLDTVALENAQFTTFGTGDYEFAHVEWGPGPHRMTADVAFGVFMTGYDSAVSYGYPGGMNLNPPRE